MFNLGATSDGVCPLACPATVQLRFRESMATTNEMTKWNSNQAPWPKETSACVTESEKTAGFEDCQRQVGTEISRCSGKSAPVIVSLHSFVLGDRLHACHTSLNWTAEVLAGDHRLRVVVFRPAGVEMKTFGEMA